MADKAPVTSSDDVKQKELEAEARQDTSKSIHLPWNPVHLHADQYTVYILGAVMGVLIFITLLMLGVAWLFGARFDIALNELMKGNFRKPSGKAAETLVEKYDHGEL